MTELRLLVVHRTDLVTDRVRVVNRLRDVLSGYFPALERAFDYASAVTAAQAQHTQVPGEDVAAGIVADLAAQLLAIDARISNLDAKLTTTFRAHPQAEIIESLPGMGPILGAELIAAAGDLSGYANAGRLASAAGLSRSHETPGRRTGNMHRPMRYSRKLRRVFYLSGQASMMREGPNRDYYLKETRRRPQTRPGTHRASPPPRRRPLGPPARQPCLRADPTSGSNRLTTSLRIHRR